MAKHMEFVKDSLKQIFDRGLEAHDRISLITYSKNARVIFSLVDKDKNFIQLRNQIDRIEANSRSSANFFKSLKEAIKEFKEYSLNVDNHRYIICLTNDFDETIDTRIKDNDVKELLKQYNANLIVIGADLDY